MANSTIQIELMKANNLSRSIGTTSNTGLYNWTIPKDVSKGADYQVRMYDINDRTNTEILSSNFTMKGKGGAGKIIIPLLAVGAGVGVLLALGGDGDPDPDPDPVVTDLPTPPVFGGSVSRHKGRRPLIGIPISF